jgi:hypothetical protein
MKSLLPATAGSLHTQICYVSVKHMDCIQGAKLEEAVLFLFATRNQYLYSALIATIQSRTFCLLICCLKI